MRRRNESGQAVAEFATVIPLIVFFVLLLIEMSVVLLDSLAVQQAAREAARTAAVTSDFAKVQAAGRGASGLDVDRLTVEVSPRPATGGLVHVDARYQAEIKVPFTGAVLFRPQLQAHAAMRVESGE